MGVGAVRDRIEEAKPGAVLISAAPGVWDEVPQAPGKIAYYVQRATKHRKGKAA